LYEDFKILLKVFYKKKSWNVDIPIPISSRHYKKFSSVFWNIIALLVPSLRWNKSTHNIEHTFSTISAPNAEAVTCTCVFFYTQSHTLMITYNTHIYKNHMHAIILKFSISNPLKTVHRKIDFAILKYLKN